MRRKRPRDDSREPAGVAVRSAAPSFPAQDVRAAGDIALVEVAVGGGPGEVVDLVAGELGDDAAQVLLAYGLAVSRRRDVGEGVQGGDHLFPPRLGQAGVLVDGSSLSASSQRSSFGWSSAIGRLARHAGTDDRNVHQGLNALEQALRQCSASAHDCAEGSVYRIPVVRLN